ncbi:MAG: protein translocase subunit SecF [Chloroherpetonaceae bacterium]|nr:protein translocase subunit SecF [Chloroherpetonaceae bacterium]
MRLLHNTNFDFIGKRKIAYVISAVMLFVGLGSMAIRGFHYGIDFKGGTEIVLRFQEPVEIAKIRAIASSVEISGVIKEFGNPKEVMITTDFSGDLNDLQGRLETGLKRELAQNPFEILKIDAVGPTIANDLKLSAVYALLGALVIILIYVSFRFEFKFAAAGVFAIFHDVLFVAGLFSLFGGVFSFMSLEVDLTVIAAFLTIVGYSITDTVVVYDRIRENLKIRKTEPYEKVFNDSLNETLSRTIITSGTVLLSVLVLFIFGGSIIRSFAFAMLIGIFVGTYSSIFIASAIVLDWQEKSGEKIKLRG